jgi:hypothetical protein
MDDSEITDGERYRFIRDHLLNDDNGGSGFDGISHIEAYRPEISSGQYVGTYVVQVSEFDAFIDHLLKLHKQQETKS